MAYGWGSIVGGYGRIGIWFITSETATTYTVRVRIWFGSKYSVSDSNNTLYFDMNATSATTSRGSVTIKTTVASGDGWSASNEVLLKEYSYTYTKGTSAKTINCAAKLINVDRVGGTMYATASITVPALASYKVSYNANGGSGAPSAQTKYYDTKHVLSSTKPTRSGYSFMGWGTSASDTSVDYAAGAFYLKNASITLYAIWKKTITLSYNANGGSGVPANQSATIYNATTSYKFTLSSTKPTRTGYTFLGWSTSNTATSATYSAGGTITLSANDVLYAVWKINSYTLTIDPNGGKYEGNNSSTISKNYQTTISISEPEWEGHTFTGWVLSGYGTLADSQYTYGAGNGTLTAKWDTNDYSVVFNASANGGLMESGTETETKSIEYETALGTLPVAVKRNYTFLGWFTEPVGGIQIGSDYVVTEDVTFYAQYEIDASAYINEESEWYTGVVFVNVEDDKPVKGRAKTNVNGIWRDGICL